MAVFRPGVQRETLNGRPGGLNGDIRHPVGGGFWGFQELNPTFPQPGIPSRRRILFSVRSLIGVERGPQHADSEVREMRGGVIQLDPSHDAVLLHVLPDL